MERSLYKSLVHRSGGAMKSVLPPRCLVLVMLLSVASTCSLASAWGASTVNEKPIMPFELTITGKVTASDDGSTLPGTNILIKGTTVGTVTDVDGNYKIVVPSDDAVLVFSSIGYATQEIPVKGKTVINVALEVDVTTLSEVVVIGYGTQ